MNSLSKCFERLLHSRLKILSRDEQWFSSSQHGFLQGKSTESACLSLISTIEHNRKSKLVTCAAFLDIKSAFDSAWHPAILRGLLDNRCPLYLVKIIASYLSNRKAIISQQQRSISTELEIGCPQGSVLSPFLWNVLLDPVLRLTFPFQCNMIAYADDLVLLTHHRNITTAHSNLQMMCDSVSAWCKSVKLILNGSKTILKVFGSRNSLLSLSIEGITVSPSPTCTYLGLLIDNKFSWRPHIKSVALRAKRKTYWISHVVRRTWGISAEKLKILYACLFVSLFTYCCSAWAGALRKKTIITLLRSAQRFLVLRIANVFNSTSSQSPLILANILPIDYKIKEMATNRALSPHLCTLIPPSTTSIIRALLQTVKNSENFNSLSSSKIKSTVSMAVTSLWNQEWIRSDGSRITHTFFPTVHSAFTLPTLKPSFEMSQLLSGHSLLNSHQTKLNNNISSLCSCSLDDESIDHFIFFCPLHIVARRPFIACVHSLSLSWPPLLFLLTSSPALWSAFSLFVVTSRRLVKR